MGFSLTNQPFLEIPHWFIGSASLTVPSLSVTAATAARRMAAQWWPSWPWTSARHWFLAREFFAETKLVGGNWLPFLFYFPINIGFLIIPIDELIFFRGVAQPPTRRTWSMSWMKFVSWCFFVVVCMQLWAHFLMRMCQDTHCGSFHTPLWRIWCFLVLLFGSFMMFWAKKRGGDCWTIPRVVGFEVSSLPNLVVSSHGS